MGYHHRLGESRHARPDVGRDSPLYQDPSVQVDLLGVQKLPVEGKVMVDYESPSSACRCPHNEFEARRWSWTAMGAFRLWTKCLCDEEAVAVLEGETEE